MAQNFTFVAENGSLCKDERQVSQAIQKDAYVQAFVQQILDALSEGGPRISLEFVQALHKGHDISLPEGITYQRLVDWICQARDGISLSLVQEGEKAPLSDVPASPILYLPEAKPELLCAVTAVRGYLFTLLNIVMNRLRKESLPQQSFCDADQHWTTVILNASSKDIVAQILQLDPDDRRFAFAGLVHGAIASTGEKITAVLEYMNRGASLDLSLEQLAMLRRKPLSLVIEALKDFTGGGNLLSPDQVQDIDIRGDLGEIFGLSNISLSLYLSSFASKAQRLEFFQRVMQELNVGSEEIQKRSDLGMKIFGEVISGDNCNEQLMLKVVRGMKQKWRESHAEEKSPAIELPPKTFQLPEGITMDTPLETYKDQLSVRAWNCLQEGQITTMGALIQKRECELLLIRNLGKGTLDEIVIFLQALHLQLEE